MPGTAAAAFPVPEEEDEKKRPAVALIAAVEGLLLRDVWALLLWLVFGVDTR